MDAQKLKAHQRLKELLREADSATYQWEDDGRFDHWVQRVKNSLVRLFGEGSNHVQKFDNLFLRSYARLGGRSPDFYEEHFRRRFGTILAVVRPAVEDFEEYEMNEAAEGEKRTNGAGHKKNNGAVSKRRKLSKHVFIVHGHDNEMKLDAEQTLKELGLKPIILHKRPNQGKTLIEKFEENANVQFAVVLLSDEDIGYAKAKGKTAARPRPRQNVILELGYFIGRLRRDRVFALKRGDIELPTDFSGVVYTPYDSAGAWKNELARELRAAGYTVNANALI